MTSQHGAAVYAERGAVVTLAAPAPVADPGGADRVVVGERPGAPPAMQHRDELERLAALVQAGQQVAVVCAVGARGVGKTQLAAAVARRAVQDWEWPLVAWVAGDTLDSLRGFWSWSSTSSASSG